MPAPASKAQTDALAEIKSMETVFKETEAESKAIKNAVEGGTPSVSGIKSAAANALKAVGEWNTAIASAKKVQATVDKDKVAVAKTLKDATTKAEKAVIAVKGEADMANKIADKYAKEDAELGATLAKVIAAAQDSKKELGGFVIGGSGIETLEENMAKVDTGKLPAQSLPPAAATVANVLKEAGAQITTAESVKSSLGPLVKKGLGAMIASVAADAKTGATLEKELGDLITKARAMLNKDLGTMKTVQDAIKKYAADDPNAIPTMTKWIEHAKAAGDKVNAYLIAGAGVELLKENMTKILAGKLPVQAVRNSIPVVQANLKNVGSEITTAESVSSSMDPIIKKNLAAAAAAVQNYAKTTETAQKNLDTIITKARAELGKDLTAVNAIVAKVKTFK